MSKNISILGFALFAAASIVLFADAPPVSAQKMENDKLSARLRMLAAYGQTGAANASVQSSVAFLLGNESGSLLRDETGRLLVYIRLSDLSPANLKLLTGAGAQIVHVAAEYRTATAYAAISDLNRLSSLGAVESIIEEYRPFVAERASQPRAFTPAIGAQTTEGDSHLNANTARSSFAVDGSGVKVGVLSDSYNRNSVIKTAAQDIASGDLPGVGNPFGHTAPVQVISETTKSSTDEGRGMLQIVHDLAPGANLAFATAFEGIFAFADNIRNLQAAGAGIIVDDVGYFAEPFFQEGPVSVAISDVVGANALYFTAAGNGNRIIGGRNVASYETPAYRPMGCPALPVWAGGDCHDFNAGAGTDFSDDVVLAAGGNVLINFQWAEPWYGVTADYDLYLLDNAGSVVEQSIDTNTVTQRPFEILYYQNPTASTQTYRIVINRYSGSSVRFKLIFSRLSRAVSVQYNTSTGGDIVGPTVYGHSASRYSISVAAAPYSSTTTPEEFSSWGPATHYFGPVIGTTPAAPSSPYVIHQPDFTATDGGCTTFFGEYTDGLCYRFFGTSAAAPHAAAIAALVNQEANRKGWSINQAAARRLLKNTARAMAGGAAESVGSGLIDAYRAVSHVASIAPKIYAPIARK